MKRQKMKKPNCVFKASNCQKGRVRYNRKDKSVAIVFNTFVSAEK